MGSWVDDLRRMKDGDQTARTEELRRAEDQKQLLEDMFSGVARDAERAFKEAREALGDGFQYTFSGNGTSFGLKRAGYSVSLDTNCPEKVDVWVDPEYRSSSEHFKFLPSLEQGEFIPDGGGGPLNTHAYLGEVIKRWVEKHEFFKKGGA